MNEPLRNVFADDKQSLRGFLRMVETQFPDEIVRIRQASTGWHRHSWPSLAREWCSEIPA